jgi:hypothetical protein
MQIAFSSSELRALCEDTDSVQLQWGIAVAGMIRRRLADLQAATTIADMVASTPQFVGSGENEQVFIYLTPKIFLALTPNLNDKGTFQNGKVVWQKVGRVKILKIEVQGE